MKKAVLVMCAAALVGTAVAQVSTQSQTSASGSANTSVQAGQSGAQVNSQNSADVNTSAQAGKSSSDEHQAQSGHKHGKAEAKGAAHSKNSASAQGGTGDINAEGTANGTVQAVLSKTIDAHKAKQGDEIVARTTQEFKGQGDTRVPKNSKLIGHVTEAKAHAKGQSESTLSIVFDKAITKDGKEIPLQATIRALAPPRAMASATEDAAGELQATAPGARPSAGGSAGLLGGATGAVGNTVGTATSATGNVAGNLGSTVNGAASSTLGATTGANGNGVQGALTSASSGVIGFKGLQLDSATNAAAQGTSTLRSTTSTVRLESGTQLLLSVAGAASQGTSSAQ